MTHDEAKRLIEAKLKQLNLPYTRLTARTIGFQDLARASCLFVKIHGWQPNPDIECLQAVAKINGFRVTTDYAVF